MSVWRTRPALGPESLPATRTFTTTFVKSFGLISMHFGTFWQELQRTERPTVMLVTLQSVKTTVKYKTTRHGDVLAPVTGHLVY